MRRNHINYAVRLLALCAGLMIISCDLLITPIKARTNPNDPNTTIQPATDLSLSLQAEGDDWGVWINWGWDYEGQDSDVEGFLIVRKSRSASANAYDGTPIASINISSENTYFDNVSANSEYPKGWKTFYSVFAYAPKWKNINEDDKLQIESDGSIRNMLNYDFNGPVYDSVNIWASQTLNVSNDAYVDNTPAWTHGTAELLANASSAVPSIISCITFDLGDTPEGNIERVVLKLWNYNNTETGTARVSGLYSDWEGGATFTSIRDDAGFYEQSFDIVAGSSDEYSLTVTDIFNQWDSGAAANYGIRIWTSTDAGTGMKFSAQEGPNPAELIVYYWNE